MPLKERRVQRRQRKKQVNHQRRQAKTIPVLAEHVSAPQAPAVKSAFVVVNMPYFWCASGFFRLELWLAKTGLCIDPQKDAEVAAEALAQHLHVKFPDVSIRCAPDLRFALDGYVTDERVAAYVHAVRHAFTPPFLRRGKWARILLMGKGLILGLLAVVIGYAVSSNKTSGKSSTQVPGGAGTPLGPPPDSKVVVTTQPKPDPSQGVPPAGDLGIPGFPNGLPASWNPVPGVGIDPNQVALDPTQWGMPTADQPVQFPQFPGDTGTASMSPNQAAAELQNQLNQAVNAAPTYNPDNSIDPYFQRLKPWRRPA